MLYIVTSCLIIVHCIILVFGKYNQSELINIPSYERQALYDLYIATNGDDWDYQEGNEGHWNFSDPNVNPCSNSNRWQGLNCTTPTSSSSYYYISEIN